MARNPIPPDRQILIGLGLAGGMTFFAYAVWDWGLLRGWMIAINLVLLGGYGYNAIRVWRQKRPKLSPWFVRVLAVLGAAPAVYVHRVFLGGREPTGLKRLLFNFLVVIHSFFLALALVSYIMFPLMGDLLSGLMKLFK